VLRPAAVRVIGAGVLSPVVMGSGAPVRLNVRQGKMMKNSRNINTTEVAPFGNPDGSRAELEDVLSKFVDFQGAGAWGGLATRKNDLTARVIVGRKGSGKTVYLRRLQAGAADEESLYADSIQQSLPTTNEIVKFCQWFPKEILTEQWMLLWNRAFIRSLVSHLLHAKELLDHVSDDDNDKFKRYYNSILREVDEVVSIYSQVSEIININSSARQIDNYLRNPLWTELEALVGRVVKNCPPVCFYIDAVDEEFGHAPMYWLRCQKGLFYQTMRFLRDSKLGGRVHIVICVRDLVISSVYQSEHMTRYLGEPHIKILKWNKDSILFFLERKVEMLDKSYFTKPSSVKTIKNWLGFDEILNTHYNVQEPIEQYIMRHTRLLPRDIVIIGNKLCEKYHENLAMNKGALTQQDIRDVVSHAAAYFGNEQLRICGSQIASNSMPPHAAQQSFSEFYTGNREYARSKEDDLKKIIKSIGKDRFTKRDLAEAEKLSTDILGNGSDPFSVLWQNGMLGYLDDENEGEKYIFYSEDMMLEFKLPRHKRKYVFHPCMVDSVGLKGNGNGPITPCR
jgi:hypothetical protein